MDNASEKIEELIAQLPPKQQLRIYKKQLLAQDINNFVGGIEDMVISIACPLLLALIIIPGFNQKIESLLNTDQLQAIASEPQPQEETQSSKPTVATETSIPKDEKAKRDRLVKVAMQWKGKHYKQGVSAMCSDFVRHAFREAGFGELPRSNNPWDKAFQFNSGTSHPQRAQSLAGTEIGQFVTDPSKLQIGDIVFFKNTYGNLPDGAITHVGINAGNGMMIDRSTRSRPVNHRPIATFRFAVGVSPNVFK